MKIKLSTSVRKAKRNIKRGSGLFLKTQLKRIIRFDQNLITAWKQ